MNKGPHSKRTRSRNNGKRHTNNKNHIYDSNGPDVRVRGTAHQVLEKYLSLARDASSAGDRISAEGYYQYAEHYYRVISAQQDGQAPPRQPRAPGHDRDGGDVMGDDPSPARTGDGEPAQPTEPAAEETPPMAGAPEPDGVTEAPSPRPAPSADPVEKPKRGRPRKVAKQPAETSEDPRPEDSGEAKSETATAA